MQPEDQWVPILRKRLTGKALATYREICPTAETSFSELKTDMLKRMGATVESARNVIWLLKVRPDDNLESYTKKLMVSMHMSYFMEFFTEFSTRKLYCFYGTR